MPARREAKSGVLGQEALVGGQSAEMELLVGVVQGQLELAAGPAIAGAGGFGREPPPALPEQLAPGESEAVAPTDPHQSFDCRALELGGGTADEIADTLEWPVLLTLFDRPGCGFFAPVTDKAQTNSEPRGMAPGLATFDRAPDVALIDIRQPHLDAVAHGVAAERVDRVEAHRLIIEECDVVLDRMVVPEPGGLVGEQAERGGVRFGKPELAERGHLTEHLFRGGFRDAASQRALAEFFPEPGDQVMRAAAAHCSAP